MATIAERVAELESRLTAINAKISASEQFRAMEEGSAAGRFRTEFANITHLYAERERIEVKLTTLRAYQL